MKADNLMLLRNWDKELKIRGDGKEKINYNTDAGLNDYFDHLWVR
jgi:hypothetical protein